MKHIFLSCLLLISSVLTAQTQVTAYTAGVTSDGAVFFLPKTAIRVNVLAEKTTFRPGEYASYAQRYLHLDGVGYEASVTYRIIGVTQMAVGVADTTKAFSVKFNNKTAATNVVLADDGVLLAINGQASSQTLPAPFVPAKKQPQPNPHQFLTEEILAAGSLAKMAQLTAQEIYDIRENRNLLVKGQADFMPNDGQQMKMMLEHLDLQDRALTSLFSGTTVCDTIEHVFYVYPSDNVANQLLFRFSRHFGMVDADDLSGEPYTITITNLNSVPRAPLDAKKKKAENGLYYNVPGRLRSVITHGQTIVSQEEMPAAQFGNVELLSPELFNKHYGTHLWLNPVTGAIDKLEAEQPKK